MLLHRLFSAQYLKLLLAISLLLLAKIAHAEQQTITYQYGDSTLLVSQKEISIKTHQKKYDIKKNLIASLKAEAGKQEAASRHYGIQFISAVGPIVSFKYWYETYFPKNVMAGASGNTYLIALDVRNPKLKTSIFDYIDADSLKQSLLNSQDDALIREASVEGGGAWIMPYGGTPCRKKKCQDQPNSPDGFAFATKQGGGFLVLFPVNSAGRGGGLAQAAFHQSPIEIKDELGNWLLDSKEKGYLYTIGNLPPTIEY